MGEVIDNMIRETPEMRESRQQQRESRDRSERADTLGDALGPVTNLEKGDLHFWTNVAQLVVLLLILREVRSA